MPSCPVNFQKDMFLAFSVTFAIDLHYDIILTSRPFRYINSFCSASLAEMTSRPASRILKGRAGGHGTPGEAGGHGTPGEAQGSGGRDIPLTPKIIPLFGAQGHRHSHSAASSRSSDSSSLVVVLVAATMLMAALASSVVY